MSQRCPSPPAFSHQSERNIHLYLSLLRALLRSAWLGLDFPGLILKSAAPTNAVSTFESEAATAAATAAAPAAAPAQQTQGEDRSLERRENESKNDPAVSVPHSTLHTSIEVRLVRSSSLENSAKCRQPSIALLILPSAVAPLAASLIISLLDDFLSLRRRRNSTFAETRSP